MGDERRGVHTSCRIQIGLNEPDRNASPVEVGHTSRPDVDMEKKKEPNQKQTNRNSKQVNKWNNETRRDRWM